MGYKRSGHTKGRHTKRRNKRSKTFKNLAESELSSVTAMSKQYGPKGKSGLDSIDTKTIRKGVSSLRNSSRGFLSMFGLNNLFGTKKNRSGKGISFYIF
jgi:hypothetical protein